MRIPIIFEIGSALGPGGFASLEGAYNLALRFKAQIFEVIGAFEKLSEAEARLTTDVSLADRATKSLLDRLTLVTGANKMAAGGVHATAVEFRDLAVFAADFSKKTGKDLKEVFDEITSELAKGTTRSFRQFGIEVKDVSDQGERQTEIMRQIQEQARGLTVEIDNAGEAYQSLANQLFESGKSLWDVFGAEKAIMGLGGELNPVMSELKTQLAEIAETSRSIPTSWAEWAEAARGLWEVLTQGGVGPSFVEQIESQLDLNTFAARHPGFTWANLPGGVFPSTPSQAPPELPPIGAEEITAPAARKGGGGGRRQGKDEMVFTEEGMAAERQTEVEGITGGQSLVDVSTLSNAEIEARIEAMAGLDETYTEYEEKRATELKTKQEESAKYWQAQQEYLDHYYEAEQDYMARSRAQWQENETSKLEMTAFFFNRVSLLQNTKSRAMFEVGKKAALAEAAVNTALGAIKAYQALAGIPYFGPALGALAALAVTAAGAAAMQQIGSQSFEGGGRVASITGAGESEHAINPTPQPVTQERQVVININIGDEPVYDAVKRAQEKRSQNGQRTFALTG